MSQTYLNPEAVMDNSIISSKLDASTFKTINGISLFGGGDIKLKVEGDYATLEQFNDLLGQFNQLMASHNNLLNLHNELSVKHNDFETMVNGVFEDLVTPWPPTEEPEDPELPEEPEEPDAAKIDGDTLKFPDEYAEYDNGTSTISTGEVKDETLIL